VKGKIYKEGSDLEERGRSPGKRRGKNEEGVMDFHSESHMVEYSGKKGKMKGITE